MSVEKKCTFCSKIFHITPSMNKKGKGKFCSKLCVDSHSRSLGAIKEVFWGNVTKTPACWIATKKPNSRGYVNLGLGKGKQTSMHRFSYEIHKGKIPDGAFVCHKCDNTLCVNPDHLFLGSHQDNVTDMVRKERNVRGGKHWANVIDESMVLKIKKQLADGSSYRDVAREVGVSPHIAFDIKRGKTWRHITA